MVAMTRDEAEHDRPPESDRPAERVHLPWGSLLESLLAAQASAAQLLTGSRMSSSAQRLVEFARQSGSPVLTPVSPMANRLVGAALLLGGSAIRASDEGSMPVGERVLLVEAVAADAAGLRSARDTMLILGAASVECVTLQLLGGSSEDVHVLLPTETLLRLAAAAF